MSKKKKRKEQLACVECGGKRLDVVKAVLCDTVTTYKCRACEAEFDICETKEWLIEF